MEIYCFKTFSTPTDTTWGSLFYNPAIAERHDANHAEVVDPSTNPSSIIQEVRDFYHSKNIPARINFYDPAEHHPFKQILVDNDFENLDTESPTIFMKLTKKINLEDILDDRDSLHVSFTPSLEVNSQTGKDIASVLHSDWTYQNLVTHNDYFYFLLYDGPEPVSVLSFFLYDPFMLARLDDVVTVPTKRNNGYSSFLLKFACNWIQNNDFIPYLFVTNEIAKKVYIKTGFEEMFRCQNVYWMQEFTK